MENKTYMGASTRRHSVCGHDPLDSGKIAAEKLCEWWLIGVTS